MERFDLNNPCRWKILFIVYATMVAFGIVYKSIPPVLTLIMESMDLTHSQGGALMSIFVFPGIILSIPGGLLADYYGPRIVGILSFSLMIVGLLFVSLGSTYLYLALGRFLSGVGGTTLSIITAQALTQCFTAKDFGLAMGIFHTAVPTGTILALNFFSLMADRWNWQLPVLITIVFTLLIFTLFLLKFPAHLTGIIPTALSESENRKQKIVQPLKEKSLSLQIKLVLEPLGAMSFLLWLAAGVWLLYNAFAVSFITFAPDYFIGRGYGIAYAGFVTSLFMAGVLVLSPLVGFISNKYQISEIFIAFSGITLAILFFLLPRFEVGTPLFWGLIIGVMAGLIPAPAFLLIPKLLPPKQAGLGFGVISTCRSIGVLIGPYSLGLLYDMTGNYKAGFTLLAVFAFLMTTVTICLRCLRLKAAIQKEISV